MTPAEYNRARQVQRQNLWRTIYALSYKAGKKNAASLACVHADTAVADFDRRHLVDLNAIASPPPAPKEQQCPST